MVQTGEMTHRRIGVLVADDHTLVRRGLVSLLSLAEGVEVVGEAADGRMAVDLAINLDPDVVVMDISMPGLNGLEATRKLKKEAPHIKVLILSAHDNEEYVLQVIRSGADGYILKNTSSEDLYSAIKSVFSGHAFFSPTVSRIILDTYQKTSNSPDQNGAEVRFSAGRLTPREREVLQLVAEGKTHQEIGDILHISVRTVDTHCTNMMKKLDIHDSAGLVTYAIKNGIVILPR